MTISEALTTLDACRWLKVTANHVSATDYKSRPELAMLTPEQLASGPNAIYRASVQTRRKKGESFEGLLVRAAMLVKVGHLPAVRVPPRKPRERCACGTDSVDLEWNHQLKQRVCRRCASAWATAAKNNDMRPTKGEAQ